MTDILFVDTEKMQTVVAAYEAADKALEEALPLYFDWVLDTYGLSQDDVALAMGVSQSYVNHVLSGKRRISPLRLKELWAILPDRRDVSR